MIVVLKPSQKGRRVSDMKVYSIYWTDEDGYNDRCGVWLNKDNAEKEAKERDRFPNSKKYGIKHIVDSDDVYDALEGKESK